MKALKLISILFITMLIFSLSVSADFTPSDGNVTSLLFLDTETDEGDQVRSVVLGSTLNFDIVVKNLTNGTVNNITLVQQIPGFDLLSVGSIDIDETGTFYGTDQTIPDTLNDQELSANYVNVTESNFTINIEHDLNSGNSIGLSFVMNVSTTTISPTINPPTVTYYDIWGDEYEANSNTPNMIIEVTTLSTDTRLTYVPDFENTDIEYEFIAGIILGLTAVVLFVRVLYFKKPFEM